jgi:hypothetical protein
LAELCTGGVELGLDKGRIEAGGLPHPFGSTVDQRKPSLVEHNTKQSNKSMIVYLASRCGPMNCG